MPSALHEFLIELLRAEPEAARHLLASLDEHLVPPDTEVRVSEPVLTPPGPPELRADLILHFHRDDRVHLGVIVEVQLRRDPRKRHAWPLYLAALHARLRCPVLLLVLTPRAEVARWAETVLHLGPGFVLKPFALGPHNHPRITPAQVETVPTAVTLLSGLIHKYGPDPAPVLEATATALARLDAEHGALYYDLLSADLSGELLQHLEATMDLSKYVWKSDFARHHRAEGEAEGIAKGEAVGIAKGIAKGKAEGKAEGEATALLTVLQARGLVPTEAQRARILSAQNPALLSRWLVRALTAVQVAEVLADD